MSGTPQGGVISPTLANLFLHYAFDIHLDHRLLGISPATVGILLWWKVVDGENLSSYPVRAIRGRCHLSLQERRGGAGTLGCDCRPLRGLQAGAASAEDE